MWDSARTQILQAYPDADPLAIWHANIDASGGRTSITYLEDGSASWAGPCARMPRQFSWDIVAATPEQITIDLWTEGSPDRNQVTFAFESPRKMTIARGTPGTRGFLRPMSFVRLN